MIYILTNPVLLQAKWPYIFMLIGILILIFVFDHDPVAVLDQDPDEIDFDKGAVIFVLFFAIFMFGLNFVYYGFLPITNGYQPITNPHMGTIYQMQGKFQVKYYPDHPSIGDEVSLYMDVCSVGLDNCQNCQNCTLTGYFFDEKENKEHVFRNVSHSKTRPIVFGYNGRPVHVEMYYANYSKKYEFLVPKQSLLQTLKILTDRWMWLFSFMSLIVGFIGTSGAIYYNRDRFTRKYRQAKKRLDGFMGKGEKTQLRDQEC